MRFLILFVICIFSTNASTNIPINKFGYYWRNWNVNDPIPFDAVKGGINKHGDRTYIAKTIYPSVGVIVPGKAVAEDHKMYFESDNLEHVSTEDIEILCALNTNRFHWVKTGLGKPVKDVLKNGHLVIGGHDRPKPIAIGRKIVGDELHIGKVVVNDQTDKFVDMRLTQDGRGWGVTDSYEVLVYDDVTDDCPIVNVQMALTAC
ncbi:hypothetical protein FQA39_LY07698 [Lamprigera yunnana]|nr:hypothetical protein FQA39_LY07698 [Lamprigera yunnana]